MRSEFQLRLCPADCFRRSKPSTSIGVVLPPTTVSTNNDAFLWTVLSCHAQHTVPLLSGTNFSIQQVPRGCRKRDEPVLRGRHVCQRHRAVHVPIVAIGLFRSGGLKWPSTASGIGWTCSWKSNVFSKAPERKEVESKKIGRPKGQGTVFISEFCKRLESSLQ